MTTDKLFTMDDEGAHIASDEVTAKLKKKNLSPSLVTGLEGCAARWVVETFARDQLPQDQDSPATRGSLFHKVMEEVFAEKPLDRTHDLVKAKVKEVLEDKEFEHFKTNREAIAWLRDAINSYYKMGGNPQTVTVARVPTKKGTQPGLEIFVRGKIGETKRDVLGFVDRVIEHPKKPGEMVVEDWKTGKKAKQWNGDIESEEGMAEQRQQVIYSMLLEERGVVVSTARLIYPVAETVVKVDPKNQDLRDKVTRDLEEADKKLQHYEETNTFEYKPSFLCSWCPLVKACPKANVKMVGKLKTAYESQPDLDVLDEFIEFQ